MGDDNDSESSMSEYGDDDGAEEDFDMEMQNMTFGVFTRLNANL